MHVGVEAFSKRERQDETQLAGDEICSLFAALTDRRGGGGRSVLYRDCELSCRRFSCAIDQSTSKLHSYSRRAVFAANFMHFAAVLHKLLCILLASTS